MINRDNAWIFWFASSLFCYVLALGVTGFWDGFLVLACVLSTGWACLLYGEWRERRLKARILEEVEEIDSPADRWALERLLR
jgi:hypothetical protein